MSGQLVPFSESMARRKKVKTSVENEPQRCKEKKFMSSKFWGAPKGVLDQVYKHVRTRKKI